MTCLPLASRVLAQHCKAATGGLPAACRFVSLRGHVWTDVDNRRTGGLPFVFDKGFGFERWVVSPGYTRASVLPCLCPVLLPALQLLLLEAQSSSAVDAEATPVNTCCALPVPQVR
jgi:hypothetical protein